MKKRLFLILLVVLLLVSLIILLVLPRNPVQRMHYRIINYWGIPNRERIVDLNSGEIWIFDPSKDPETNEYLTRDKNAENQGYTLLCELTPAQIRRMQVVFHLCGVQNWKEKYSHIRAFDANSWSTSVTYADGSESVSFGLHLDRPIRHDILAWYLRQLTGIDYFLLDS